MVGATSNITGAEAAAADEHATVGEEKGPGVVAPWSSQRRHLPPRVRCGVIHFGSEDGPIIGEAGTVVGSTSDEDLAVGEHHCVAGGAWKFHRRNGLDVCQAVYECRRVDVDSGRLVVGGNVFGWGVAVVWLVVADVSAGGEDLSDVVHDGDVVLCCLVATRARGRHGA